MKILGVDPGINGAIASYDGSDLVVIDIPKLKSKGRGFEVNWALLADNLRILFGGCDHAVIEAVQARPGEGRGTAFKFGYSAGGVRGLIAGMGYPITMVQPRSWKAKMKLTTDKDYSRTRATELFPASADEFKLKKDNNKAEAALIAYYGLTQLQIEEK